ncbi:EAL domain-containing protein [Martelella mediterranea]|uniref:putative bifunctional diguanylate cyclase/phosphodiesterase n=1 Tax=Martelella mediterranea TaxID=293089 RepID=UPI001E417CE5|nr:EAL domain-containing protein [Martelella mediterranea]MCD1632920.1 EAL domain-containing protein [Martelella mediterranea]
METLKNVRNVHDHSRTTRLLTALTILFFVTLAIGTYAGGVFVRESIKEERRLLAEGRLSTFGKALRSIFEVSIEGGKTLSAALASGNDISHFESATKSYLATAPWTQAVVLQQPDQTPLVLPQSAREAVLSMPLPPKENTTQQFFGPYTLPDGQKGLIYRIDSGDDVIELVIGFRSVLEAVGLLELAQSTQFSVEVDGAGKAQAIAGNANLNPEDTVNFSTQIGNAKWTIRVLPDPLDQGPNNWSRLFLMFAGIVVLAFLTPLIALIILLRARLRDNRHIDESMMAIDNLSRQLYVALNASNIGLWEHDLDSGEQIWDDQILKLYGIEGQGRIHTFEEWRSFLHPDDRARMKRFKWRETGDTSFRQEYRIVTPDGTEKTLRSAGNAFRDAAGRRKYVGVNWDISADKAQQKALTEAKARAEAQNAELENARLQMEKFALEDPLTGVANRRHFEKKLEAAQTDGTLREGAKLVLIDLDGFKTLNDTMGHVFGDDVLRLAAKVFTEKLGPDDFLARTGGDEFVVLMPPESDVDAFTDELASAFARPVEIDGRACRVGISIGIAVVDAAPISASELLVKADLALYDAKNRGRGRTVHFTQDLMARTFEMKRLADDLQEGLERGEITAFYQPILDSRTSEVIGVEALARWRHPQRGMLEPKTFIDVAEKHSLLHRIDEIVFARTLGVLSRCEAEGIAVPTLSVNVSAPRLQEPSLLRQLRDAELPPGKLHFELLESIPFDDSDNALLKIVNEIRDIGIGIDLDDFGSGYASLVGLTQVRPDRLKIAGQLIEPIIRSPESLLIVETIAKIAESFEIQVICEGVLSAGHRDKLDAIGCHFQQGYFFARPMDEDQIVRYLTQRLQ